VVRVARERGVDGVEVEEPADLGLLDGAGQGGRRERRGDVEEGPGDGRDGDATMRGDVLGSERG
jgi:hypothetical protein